LEQGGGVGGSYRLCVRPADRTGRDYLVNTMIGLSWVDYVLIAAALLAALYALRLFKNIE
jgi:hypothetical protein